MWEAIGEIARRERMTADQICTLVDLWHHESTLTAGVRVFAVSYFRSAATEDGHGRAGHGSLRLTKRIYAEPLKG